MVRAVAMAVLSHTTLSWGTKNIHRGHNHSDQQRAKEAGQLGSEGMEGGLGFYSTERETVTSPSRRLYGRGKETQL
jgi:hypothetical protein